MSDTQSDATATPKKIEKIIKDAKVKKDNKKPVKKDSKKETKKGTKKPTKKETKKPAKKETKKPVKKPTKTKPKKPTKELQQEGDTDKKVRYFKCQYEGEIHGRFCGYKPKQAANKALTAILKARKAENKPVNNVEIVFDIIESTRGSKQKTYHYTGQRVELETPMVVNIKANDTAKQITYKYNNRVQKRRVASETQN